MAISRASDSSIQDGLPKYNDIWDGTTATSAFDSLGSVRLTSATSTITFSNIPQTYTHLQFRFLAGGSTAADAYIRFNNDSAANYFYHQLRANGPTPQAYAYTTQNQMSITTNIGQSSTLFNTGVCDLLDYTSTNKNKTLRSLTGYDLNGSGEVVFLSGAWNNSSTAISRIDLIMSTGTFRVDTQFSLYGIK